MRGSCPTPATRKRQLRETASEFTKPLHSKSTKCSKLVLVSFKDQSLMVPFPAPLATTSEPLRRS